MRTNLDFGPTSKGHPDWDKAVKVWNQLADTSDGIYYKLVEQLKSHFTTWKANLNVKTTLSLTQEERGPGFVSALDASSRHLPSTANAQVSDSHAGSTFDPRVASPAPNNSHTSDIADGLRTMALEPPSNASTSAPAPPSGPNLLVINQPAVTSLSTNYVEQVQAAREVEKSERRPRTCQKCGNQGGQGCSGRKGANFCELPCRDCGAVNCLGRNSAMRDKPCWEVKEIMEQKLLKKRPRDP
ncbi:hypothetical protein BKA70DRAFT_1242692 [Coprinopsis sp. MPI-PUGE-AT-0042]|nr:hypothetical protein BKA70DRAFT_1242692 [Coprinopsis sp. MPI-PUGE-AT-0042]